MCVCVFESLFLSSLSLSLFLSGVQARKCVCNYRVYMCVYVCVYMCVRACLNPVPMYYDMI